MLFAEKGVLAEGKTPADPVIPTMPEVKEHAAKAIARAAKNGTVLECRKNELVVKKGFFD